MPLPAAAFTTAAGAATAIIRGMHTIRPVDPSRKTPAWPIPATFFTDFRCPSTTLHDARSAITAPLLPLAVTAPCTFLLPFSTNPGPSPHTSRKAQLLLRYSGAPASLTAAARLREIRQYLGASPAIHSMARCSEPKRSTCFTNLQMQTNLLHSNLQVQPSPSSLVISGRMGSWGYRFPVKRPALCGAGTLSGMVVVVARRGSPGELRAHHPSVSQNGTSRPPVPYWEGKVLGLYPAQNRKSTICFPQTVATTNH